MKRIYSRIACVLLILACCFSLFACASSPAPSIPTQATEYSQQASSYKIEGNGFSSPEAAITAYAKALQNGNMDEMIATYAIESYVEHFDLENYLRKYPSIILNSDIAIQAQNSNEFASEVSKYTQLAIVTKEIKRAYCNLVGLDANTTYTVLNDEQALANLVNQLAAPDFKKDLSEMKIGKVLTRDDFTFIYVEEGYDRQLNEMLSYLSVSELCDVALEIDFAGEEYYLFMRTAKIDGKWYNITTSSMLVFYVLENENVTTTVFHKR